MRSLYLCCFVLQIMCVLVLPQKTILDSEFGVRLYRRIYDLIFRITENPNDENGRSLTDARIHNKIQQRIPTNVSFPCNITGGRSLKTPESVHRLRPGDIDIIAAIGDSLTAGAGLLATNVLHVPITNRGVNGIIGGQGTWREYLTLSNILKEYNPNLFGYSLGDSQTTNTASQFNVAEIGATSADMPHMARFLVNRIKSDPRVDINKHWKLIYFSIGSNDFCSEMCYHSSPWIIIKNHKVNTIKTLKILRDNLPRTMVILASPPHLKALVATRKGREKLPTCYFLTQFECSCMFGLQFRQQRLDYYDVMSRWHDVEEEIANYPEFQRTDFVVVHIPILTESDIPLADDGFTDMSYLSPDCFHPSQKTNALFALAMWNTLFEPVGNKSTNWNLLFDKLTCVTPKNPYLMTLQNSHGNNKIMQKLNK